MNVVRYNESYKYQSLMIQSRKRYNIAIKTLLPTDRAPSLRTLSDSTPSMSSGGEDRGLIPIDGHSYSDRCFSVLSNCFAMYVVHLVKQRLCRFSSGWILSLCEKVPGRQVVDIAREEIAASLKANQ